MEITISSNGLLITLVITNIAWFLSCWLFYSFFRDEEKQKLYWKDRAWSDKNFSNIGSEVGVLDAGAGSHGDYSPVTKRKAERDNGSEDSQHTSAGTLPKRSETKEHCTFPNGKDKCSYKHKDSSTCLILRKCKWANAVDS